MAPVSSVHAANWRHSAKAAERCCLKIARGFVRAMLTSLRKVRRPRFRQPSDIDEGRTDGGEVSPNGEPGRLSHFRLWLQAEVRS